MEKFNGKMCPLSIDDADNAYSYMPEVSEKSSFVYGVESFKEQVKEAIPGVYGAIGGLTYKAGKKLDKYFPDGIKLFNGAIDIKIGDELKSAGDTLINTANRQIEIFEEEYKKKNPRLEKAQENLAFDIGNQGANWTSLLLAGSVGAAGKAMGGLVLSGEFKERAEKYKQEHGGSLEGFTEEYSDDAAYNFANAYVQGVEEKYLGSLAQVKSVKKGWGFVKAIGKNAVQEGFVEEPLQDVTDFYFDKVDGFNEDEELKDRLKNNLRGYVVASVFGGAGGFAGALAQRSQGIDMYKEALKNTVPEEDLENVATKAYEQDAKTLKDVVVVEMENSSSLRNRRGKVFENMYNSTVEAIKDAKSKGAYSELETEDDIASYAQAESEKFADWALAEANRRNTVIEEVVDSSKIAYKDGKLEIGMTNGIAPYNEVVDKVEEIIEEKTTPQETAQTEETSVSSQEENVEEVITQENQEETKGDSLAEIVSDAIEETGLAEQTKETQPVDKIEDYGEKLEGAKKDREYEKAEKQGGKTDKEKLLSKVKDENQKAIISRWLDEQSDDFVRKLAEYNHTLVARPTQEYRGQIFELLNKSEIEKELSGEERYNVIYRGKELSDDINKKYGLKPEYSISIKEGDRLWNASESYIDRKLGERGQLLFQYNKSTRGGYYLWVKKGKGGWHILESFDSKEDMEKHRDSHTREQLEKLLKEKTDVTQKEKPIRKRQGEDYRNGKDVAAKDFTEQFGFRGVQFGNYENNEKRQRELNNAYDSLMDLANILNIPPRAISLEGKLGIAFGARGSGSAAAHYEPDSKIINITRDSGAGAIGHEWFHALDNYLAGGEKYVTGGQRDEMRMELRKKLVSFLSAIETASDYQSRLALLGQYWKRKWEIGARAFELYLTKKMEEKDVINDYLAQDRSDEIPYLNKSEQEKILPYLDEFFKAIQTEETEQGIRLYQESLDLANENARLDDIYPAYEGETITIDGKERTVYNSNGDRIAKSKEALENFYRWFGDSKVVDGQGRPLVVYHGGGEGIEIFDYSRIGQQGRSEGAGFEFTENKDIAQGYADRHGGGLYSVYLRIEKPIRDLEQKTLTDEQKYAFLERVNEKVNQDAEYVEEMGEDSVFSDYMGIDGAFEAIENDTDVDVINELINTTHRNKEILEAFVETTGYDGVILKEGSEWYNNGLYVVFTNKQIKSTSNRGTYSESENNIYYQSAFAGSRVDYDRPSLEAIGSGEGNQAHGWGLYYALNRKVAEENYYKRFKEQTPEHLEYDGQSIAYYIQDEIGQDFMQDATIEAIEKATKFYDGIKIKDSLITNLEKASKKLKKTNKYDMAEKERIDKAIEVVKKMDNESFNLIKPQLHEVDIPENPYLLDEDATYFAQPEIVRNALDEVINNLTDEQISKEFEGTVYPENRDALRRMWKTGDYDFRNEGGDIYNSLSKMLGSKKAASQMLEKYGIKGITYFGRQDGRCFVIFNPDDVKVIQKFYQGEKGSIEFRGDKALINLTEKADSTTLPHELAHYYLQNTFLYTKSGLASAEYMNNFNQIAKYLGITQDQENIKDWQQEKFARAYELYQMGNAPEGMDKPLTQYNQWLRKAYDGMQEPMYRDENGEMKVPEFDYDTMKMFASLAGETLTEPQFKENQERVRGLAKSTSEMAKQKGIGTETPMYEPRSSTEMGKKADEFIKNNKQLAVDIVKGLAPEQDGLFRQDLFAALRELALNEGDSDLLNELSRSMTVEEATELGQRIQALSRGTVDPVRQMTELRDERMKKEKVTKEKVKEETKNATKEIKKEIALAAQPKEWQDFIKSLEC